MRNREINHRSISVTCGDIDEQYRGNPRNACVGSLLKSDALIQMIKDIYSLDKSWEFDSSVDDDQYKCRATSVRADCKHSCSFNFKREPPES